MTSFLSGIFASRLSTKVQVPAVQIYDIEDAVEKPARSLRHLVKLNHISHSLRSHDAISSLQVPHNIVAHHLVSAFLFGADNTQLDRLYEVDSKSLTPWQDAPGEVVGDDWMDFLGKKKYERAFLDFFEDKLVDEGYDWKAVLHKFLFNGKYPLISSITVGLGQPLIHLALALQMSSRDLAMEALTLVATNYHDNDIFKYSDDLSYFQAEPSHKSSSILEILEKVRTDKEFSNLASAGEHNFGIIFRDHEAALLNHCNAWTISSDPTTHFRESQMSAVALFLGAKAENKHNLYLLYPLLMSHAMEIILPQTPEKIHIPLLKQWWLATLAIYVSQLRPEIESETIAAYDLRGKDWDWIAQQAVDGPHSADAHFVKTLRVLRELGVIWVDSENYYLKAAVKFINEFNGWYTSI